LSVGSLKGKETPFSSLMRKGEKGEGKKIIYTIQKGEETKKRGSFQQTSSFQGTGH